MARFVVEGGTPLRGEITPAGNKNEALPLIAASLLTDEPVTLHNLPRIRDVRNMLEIASALGATVEDLGAALDMSAGGFTVTTTGLRGADVILDEPSVTATENALLAAAVAKGRTPLHNAASEPHVQQLAKALVAMGGKISGVGTNTLVVDGVESLHGTDHTLLGDH